MTFAEYMMSQFSLVQYAEFFARILIACVCGAVIGFERSMRFKEAGIRTHIIVCCAAALMMIVSKYGFVDLVDSSGKYISGTRDVDAARIAAQVISGVSFLGAGIIFRNGTSIRGLTTAAGIWATAGIGLAVGAGLYVLGIFTTIVIGALQVIMHKYTISGDAVNIGQLHCKVDDSTNFTKMMNDFIDKNNMQIIQSKVAVGEDGIWTYDLTLRMNQKVKLSTLSEFLVSNDNIKEIRCELGK